MPTDFNGLFLLATSQQGFFTASQAARLGYSQQNQDRHVKAGNWNRVNRGIFRMEHYPPPKNPDLVICHLWALDINDQPGGAFSYETALQFYELSDWTGSGLHMIVPRKFRRRSKPPFHLVLHREDMGAKDIQKRDCFLLTTPLKTILDLLFQEAVEQRFLKQAISQAWERGLVSKRQIESRQLTDWQSAKVAWLLNLAGIDDVKVAKSRGI
jgi:predicted transcriptional regulator of viral defense system